MNGSLFSPAFVNTATLTVQTVSSATATNGTGVDVSKFEGELFVHVSAPVASASDTITFTVEHSEDNSSFSAVTSTDLVNRDGDASTFTVVTDAVPVDEVLYLKKTGDLKRYVRVVATTVGTTVTATFGAWVGGFAKYSENNS